MTQYDTGLFEPSDTGVQLATDLNGLVASLLTSHKGPARPSYVRPGMSWIDDSGGDWLLKLFDGTADVTFATIDPVTHATKDIYLKLDASQVLSDLQKAALQAMLGVPSSGLVSTKAAKRNRHINPAFQVCQDRATGATIVLSAGNYAFDGAYVWAAGGGTLTCSQAAKVTPGGSPFRFRAAVSTVDAAIAASDAYTLSLSIEGTDVADLQFGTASAKTFVWRGAVNFPAGTYGLAFKNGALTRSYVTTFTISPAQAGTDVLVSAVVPGDTAGAWITDASGIGLRVEISFAQGSAGQTATLNAWQAGNFASSAAQTNGMASTANVFEIADVGLYTGAELPAWEMPSFADDYLRCQRYFQLVGGGWSGMEEDTTHFSMAFQFSPMRTTPSLSLRSTSISTRMSNGSGDRVITECSINTPAISQRAGWVYLNCVGGNSPGRFVQDRLGQPIFTANARL